MRLILCLFLAVFSTYAFADHIKCYSNGKLIYSGYGQDVIYRDGMFIMRQESNNRYLFLTGDCVASMYV